MAEMELHKAKEYISKASSLEWTLIDSKEGVLVYSDKRGVNLSRTKLV